MALAAKRPKDGCGLNFRLRRRGVWIAAGTGAIWLFCSMIAAATPAPALRATPIVPLPEEAAPATAPEKVERREAETVPDEKAPVAAESGLQRIERLPVREAERESTPAMAPPPAAIPLPEPAKRTREDSVFHGWSRPLSEYLRGNDALIFRHRFDRRAAEIPIPWRAMNPEFGIVLRSQSSGTLDPDLSQMVLRWNGKTFAQELIGESGDLENLVAQLPMTEASAGSNRLEISVVQGRLEERGEPFHPDLWTQVLPRESMLTLRFQLRPLEEPTLDRIPELIDSRWWKCFEWNLLTPGAEEITERQLSWMLLVSQRVALLLGDTPMEVGHVRGIRGRGDHIAVGTREELASILPRGITESITGSFLGVFPHPDDSAYFLLVLSGTDYDGVDRAVRVFLDGRAILPSCATVDLSDAPDFPVPAPARGKSGSPAAALAPGFEYRFSQLGYETIDGDGLDEGQYAIRFRLPPGLRAAPWAKAKLSLKMDWTAATAGSVEVRLNGRSIESIELGENNAAGLRECRVRLPINLFAGGRNTLVLAPDLRPAHPGNRGEVDWAVQRFVLSSDSSIRVPRANRILVLPDLSLLSRGAIPAVGRTGKGAVLTVWPSSGDSETLGAACTLIGKLAQVAGEPLPDVRLSFRIPEPEDHYLAVGPAHTIDRRLVPRKILEQEPGEILSLAAIGGEELVRDMAGSGLICQFESPLHSGRIGMLLTASESRQLREQVKQLVQADTWGELAGDTFAWRAESDQRMILKRFPAFAIGDAGPLGRLWLFVASRWLWFAGAMAATACLVAIGIVRARTRSPDPIRRQIENRRRMQKRGESPIWDRRREMSRF